MGCMMGSDGAEPEPVVEEEEEDPLKVLLRQIEQQRVILREKMPDLERQSVRLRYHKVMYDKFNVVLQTMGHDHEAEQSLHSDLVYHIAEQDCLDIREACDGFGTNEEKLGSVILGRLPETIKMTDEMCISRCGRSLEDYARGENKTLLGLLGADSLTDFGRFLVYRCMPEDKRDAMIVRKCVSGMGCSDFILIEVLSTRTNEQLQKVAAAYAEEFDGEDMVERIKTETGGWGKKWYGMWIDSLVELDRDESEEVPEDVADKAQALYDAGAGKWTGCDEQVFIDVLCKASTATCAALVTAYDELEKSKRTLFEDIEKEMGGDLEFAVLARVRPKLAFYAERLYKACKGIGTDEERIARILGCLDNGEILEMRDTFNEMYAEEEPPLNCLASLLESELSGSFKDAVLVALGCVPPKGHWRGGAVYDPEAQGDADEFSGVVEAAYEELAAADKGRNPLEAGIELVGVEDVFLQEGYNFAQEPFHPQYESPDMEYLLNSTPEEVEEAQQLLAKLKANIIEVEHHVFEANSCNEGHVRSYVTKSKDTRKVDHLIKQLREDNMHMLEFCASRDADALHEAMDGWGTDENKLIRVLCSLTRTQLKRVDEIYLERYEKKLREVIDGELSDFFSGNFQLFVLGLLTPTAEFDADLLVSSMKGLGTNDKLLCELVCTRTNCELRAATVAFEAKQGNTLTSWLDGDTDGFYQRFLFHCLRANRHEGHLDKEAAKREAQDLQDAGLGGGEVDESVFIRILARASEEQVAEIKNVYQESFGKSISEAIAETFGGDIERALLARVYDKCTYFAVQLRNSMEGLGTDETALARIMARQTKPDIQHISERYENLYSEKLYDRIRKETSGKFKTALLTYLHEDGIGEEDVSVLVKEALEEAGE